MSQLPSKGLSEKKLIAIIAILTAVVLIASIAVFLTTPELGEFKLFEEEYVAVVKVKGEIASGSAVGIFGTQGIDSTIELIREAEKDPLAKAVIIYINSPGGEAGASESLYYAVAELAEKKPVIAYIEGLGASGAYMAVLPANEIIASNSSLVGSIGVYSTVIVAQKLLEKVGVQVYVYKSGELKDMGSPYRNMTGEEAKVMQEIVDNLFKVFKARVEKHRGKLPEEVFTGRPFVAAEALKLGLIDKIGNFQDALNEARKLAGLPSTAPYKELKPEAPSLFNIFGESTSKTLIVPKYAILTMWPPPQTVIISP